MNVIACKTQILVQLSFFNFWPLGEVVIMFCGWELNFWEKNVACH